MRKRERKKKRERPEGSGQHWEGRQSPLPYRNFRKLVQAQWVPMDPYPPMLLKQDAVINKTKQKIRLLITFS